MKKFFLLLPCLVVFGLLISYFIPSVRKKEIFVSNTYKNVLASATNPGNWISWDPSVRQAWLKDSSACTFTEDTIRHITTIDIPGKKITVTQLSYLAYQLEETKSNHSSFFVLTVIPFVGNDQLRSRHNATIGFAEDSRWLYKIFPFLDKGSFAQTTISNLADYLNNTTRFYGFSIEVKQTTADTMFLTRKETLPKKDLFQKIPILFDTLEHYAQQVHVQAGHKNIYYNFLPHDSIEILAGLNIDKRIEGDYLHSFMEMPTGQALAVARFEGPFRDRLKAYEAMEKYIPDHELIKLGVCFEKYLSPLPQSDSSVIQIELSYPLRF
ncbi:MAG: GyrI-like domain-containing protein [Puia sp.]|nr:GyrI-like domain-containing protein [Puia sp.]